MTVVTDAPAIAAALAGRPRCTLAVLAVSAHAAVALTADKLGTAAPFVVCPVAALHHLVVEAGTPEAALDGLGGAGLRPHRADPA